MGCGSQTVHRINYFRYRLYIIEISDNDLVAFPSDISETLESGAADDQGHILLADHERRDVSNEDVVANLQLPDDEGGAL